MPFATLRTVHEVADLFLSKTDPPEHALISFARERPVEDTQARRILEGIEVLTFARFDEVHHLREDLDQCPGPTTLLRQ